MSKGIPKDVILEWDDVERIAAIILLGEADGNSFDWSVGTWKKRD